MSYLNSKPQRSRNPELEALPALGFRGLSLLKLKLQSAASPQQLGNHLRIGKLILIGLLLATLGIAPLCYQFMPTEVHYFERQRPVSLHPGLNTIGGAALTLDEDGRVLAVQKIQRHLVHWFFGFESVRTFLIASGPYFSLLSFCLFFLWYDKQKQHPYIRDFKRYVLCVFLFTSGCFTYWALVPGDDPIAYPFYCAAMGVGGLISGIALRYLYKYSLSKLRINRKLLHALTYYILRVRDVYYLRLALRAFQKEKVDSKTRKQIQQYGARTFEALDEVAKHY